MSSEVDSSSSSSLWTPRKSLAPAKRTRRSRSTSAADVARTRPAPPREKFDYRTIDAPAKIDAPENFDSDLFGLLLLSSRHAPAHCWGKRPRAAASKKQSVAENFKCEWCNKTKTPQIRAGPNGKRTLCNGCGIRWARESNIARPTKGKPFSALRDYENVYDDFYNSLTQAERVAIKNLVN